MYARLHHLALIGMGGYTIRNTPMKDPKDLPDGLIAPIVKPDEIRQRMRNIEHSLYVASDAIKTATEEYNYLVYGDGKPKGESQ